MYAPSKYILQEQDLELIQVSPVQQMMMKALLQLLYLLTCLPLAAVHYCSTEAADLLAELAVELHLDLRAASSAVAAAAGKKPAEMIDN